MAAIRTQCHQVFSPLPSSPPGAVVVLVSQVVVLVVVAVVVVVLVVPVVVVVLIVVVVGMNGQWGNGSKQLHASIKSVHPLMTLIG